MQLQTNTKLRSHFIIFTSIVTTLIIIGSIFIYSASSVFALETFGSSHYFVKKQLIGIVVGLIGLIIARSIPLQYIQRCSPLFFISSLLLTALTLFSQFSRHIHGSSRWLSVAGFTFQPSELLKFSFLLYLAYFFTRKKEKIFSLFNTYIPFLFILGITSLVLLKQPDFGLTVTLVTTAMLLFFITQKQFRYAIITLCAAIPAGILLIIIRPYRLKRVLTFLNPWNDPQGSGFQIIQSLIAIGSGSWIGVGISASKQKFFYLPMQHTDFIFSIIAEETGFIGSSLIIFLFITLLYVGIKIANKLTETFSKIVTLGFVLLTSLQAMITIAVATGLAPTKGIGLPFVSYGNTALACNIAMIGLLSNIVHHEMYRVR